MGRRITSSIKKFFSRTDSRRSSSPKNKDDVDVREEYANAFRTESYFQFWTRVSQLNHKDSATCTPIGSTTSSRLMSYRLFAENLLDPNQMTVNRIIHLIPIRQPIHFLLSDYFSETANASFLCTILLRDVDHIRSEYDSLKPLIQSFELQKIYSNQNFEVLINPLMELSNSINLFISSSSSISRIRVIQSNCSALLSQLESSKDKTRAKFKLLSRIKHGSGIFVVALTTTLFMIIASHTLALLIAMPSFSTAWLKLIGLTERLTRESDLLDITAKGTYIVSRDLDTISRLVTRLNDELEHVRAMAKFWNDRGLDQVRANTEVVRQLERSDESFSEQLYELEEHLYLCFMTINRARNLVVKKILNPSQAVCPLGPKSKKKKDA